MKVYVWTLPTRIFHLLLVVLTVAAFATSDSEALLNIHAAVGATIGVLILFRIIWGLIGPKYSRFSDLNLNPSDLIAYLKSLHGHGKSFTGHNPAASYAVVGILGVMLLLLVSGMLTYGIQENRGLFAFLHGSFFRDMELFEALHEFLGGILLVLVAAHVGGVILDRILHAEHKTLNSIFDGYKHAEGEHARLKPWQSLIAILGIGGAFFVLVYTLSIKENPVTASYHSAVDYKTEHRLFAAECGDCHTLYPPSLLPRRSWERLMGDLGNHFGDDASLEPQEEQSILAYLVQNAAETSSSEASVKILQSMPNQDMIAVTQTPFWKRTHSGIAQNEFESGAVKSRANCKACHSDVERGLIEDCNIVLPHMRS